VLRAVYCHFPSNALICGRACGRVAFFFGVLFSIGEWKAVSFLCFYLGARTPAPPNLSPPPYVPAFAQTSTRLSPDSPMISKLCQLWVRTRVYPARRASSRARALSSTSTGGGIVQEHSPCQRTAASFNLSCPKIFEINTNFSVLSAYQRILLPGREDSPLVPTVRSGGIQRDLFIFLPQILEDGFRQSRVVSPLRPYVPTPPPPHPRQPLAALTEVDRAPFFVFPRPPRSPRNVRRPFSVLPLRPRPSWKRRRTSRDRARVAPRLFPSRFFLLSLSPACQS